MTIQLATFCVDVCGCEGGRGVGGSNVFLFSYQLFLMLYCHNIDVFISVFVT